MDKQINLTVSQQLIERYQKRIEQRTGPLKDQTIEAAMTAALLAYINRLDKKARTKANAAARKQAKETEELHTERYEESQLMSGPK